jgi:hypothetical protein
MVETDISSRKKSLLSVSDRQYPMELLRVLRKQSCGISSMDGSVKIGDCEDVYCVKFTMNTR